MTYEHRRDLNACGPELACSAHLGVPGHARQWHQRARVCAGGRNPESGERLPLETSPEIVISSLVGEGGDLRRASDQRSVDNVLRKHQDDLGPDTILGISVGYLNASARTHGVPPYVLLRDIAGLDGPDAADIPTLLLNVLNGGAHARTNPILSDFPEYLLVPRSSQLKDYLAPFREIQQHVRRELGRLSVIDNDGSPVHTSPTSDNRAWIEFLLDILEDLGLASEFDVMIDASANDFERDGLYRFSRTDGRVFDRDQFVEYWLALSNDYPMVLIEDPFAEDDFGAWTRLQEQVRGSTLVGDNLCSTDASKIRHAADEHMIGAVLIKPNQAGTVTETVAAVTTAVECGVAPIPSHRSVETDVPWLADLCYAFNAAACEAGPACRISRPFRKSTGSFATRPKTTEPCRCDEWVGRFRARRGNQYHHDTACLHCVRWGAQDCRPAGRAALGCRGHGIPETRVWVSSRPTRGCDLVTVVQSIGDRTVGDRATRLRDTDPTRMCRAGLRRDGRPGA